MYKTAVYTLVNGGITHTQKTAYTKNVILRSMTLLGRSGSIYVSKYAVAFFPESVAKMLSADLTSKRLTYRLSRLCRRL